MTETVPTMDRIRAVFVLAATLGTVALNWLATRGFVGYATRSDVSGKYLTVITPANYAFTIWTLIYAGLIAFSIVQLLPGRIDPFRPVRSLYVLSAALNCAWIFFWNQEQIAICFVILAALVIVLFLINSRLPDSGTPGERFLVGGTFGLYLGWAAAMTLLNFAVLVVYAKIGRDAENVIGIGLVLVAAGFGVLARARWTNYFAPLAIAWMLTAIAVKQSANTLLVVATAIGVVACLIASASFVMNLKSSRDE